MQNAVTIFDTSKHHIYLEFEVFGYSGNPHTALGILDTGASKTEFSDKFLEFTGLFKVAEQNLKIKPGLDTQRYAKVSFPQVKICSHSINNFEAFVSRFDKSWGIDALIGLDFFRQFEVTINYQRGHILSQRYLA